MRRAQKAIRNRQTAQEYGDAIARYMAWAWFVTITFRGAHAPGRQWVRAQLDRFLNELADAAGCLVRWVMVDGFGGLGGRLHHHLLIAGVEHLNIDVWKRRACEQFGRTEIELYDSSGGAAHYIAQHALSENGNLEFGGNLLKHPEKKVNSSLTVERKNATGKRTAKRRE